MSAIGDAVAALPQMETSPSGEEIERVGVVVIDLGGHPEVVAEILRERAGQMAVWKPTASSYRIRVLSFGEREALDLVAEAVVAAGHIDYWRGFTSPMGPALKSWGETKVQLIVGALTEENEIWRAVLEDGCAWYEVDDAS